MLNYLVYKHSVIFALLMINACCTKKRFDQMLLISLFPLLLSSGHFPCSDEILTGVSGQASMACRHDQDRRQQVRQITSLWLEADASLGSDRAANAPGTTSLNALISVRDIETARDAIANADAMLDDSEDDMPDLTS